MTDRELMQQALEALEGLADTSWTAAFKQRKYDSDEPKENVQREFVLGAITALRERLAQPQRTHWEGCEEVHPECKTRRTTREEKIVRPGVYEVPVEREPVALETIYDTIIHWDETDGKRSRRELARRIFALYTTPPRREWVGLTQEEIFKLSDDIDGCEDWHLQFARAIEAKLKEKNA